eukprot:3107149-Lingulodinium_polyedra.AAC.1
MSVRDRTNHMFWCAVFARARRCGRRFLAVRIRRALERSMRTPENCRARGVRECCDQRAVAVADGRFDRIVAQRFANIA